MAAEVTDTGAPLTITLEIAGLREDITVTATPGAGVDAPGRGIAARFVARF